MLKIRVNKGKVEFDMEGSILELAAETLTLIHGMFLTIYQNDGDVKANLFRYVVEQGVNDPECGTWEVSDA